MVRHNDNMSPSRASTSRSSQVQPSARRSWFGWVVAFIVAVGVLVAAGAFFGVLHFGPDSAANSPSTQTPTATVQTPTPAPTTATTATPSGNRLAINRQIREAVFTCGENLLPLSSLTAQTVTFIYAASDAPPRVARDQAVYDLCDRYLGGSNWRDLSPAQINTVHNGDYGQWTNNNAVALRDDAGDVILVGVNEANQVAVMLWGPAGTVDY